MTGVSDAVAWLKMLGGQLVNDTILWGASFRSGAPVHKLIARQSDLEDPDDAPRLECSDGSWKAIDAAGRDQLADPWLYGASIVLVAASATEWDIFEPDAVTPLALDEQSMHLVLGLQQRPGADFTLTNGGTRIEFTTAPDTGLNAPVPWVYKAKRAVNA